MSWVRVSSSVIFVPARPFYVVRLLAVACACSQQHRPEAGSRDSPVTVARVVSGRLADTGKSKRAARNNRAGRRDHAQCGRQSVWVSLWASVCACQLRVLSADDALGWPEVEVPDLPARIGSMSKIRTACPPVEMT